MAIFKFPNLARQTESSATQRYYSGLGKANPVGDTLGNQTLAKTGTAPTIPNLPPGYNGPIFGPEQRNNLFGTSGRDFTSISTGDPSAFANRPYLYDPQYYEAFEENMGDIGTQTHYRLRPNIAQRLNGRIQVGDAHIGGSHGNIKDPSLIEWDDDFGYLTTPDNFVVGADPLAETIFPALTLATMGTGVAGMFGYGPFAGGVTGAGTAPAHMSTMLEGYGGAAGAGTSGAGLAGLTTSVDGANLALAPSTGVGAAAGVGTGAAAPTLMETLFGSGGVGSFLQSPAGIVAGALLNNQLTNRYNRDAQGAADRADPFGQYRQQFAQRLIDLYKDPSSIENTPGYQFRRDQGEQAIERQAAKRGYFRSPNMLFDLSKFNSGLAQQAYNQEIQNLMALSGANQSGGTAGQILAGSATRSNNMRASTLGDLLDAGGSIVDWIMEQA
jgi:hypothetical protein